MPLTTLGTTNLTWNLNLVRQEPSYENTLASFKLIGRSNVKLRKNFMLQHSQLLALATFQWHCWHLAVIRCIISWHFETSFVGSRPRCARLRSVAPFEPPSFLVWVERVRVSAKRQRLQRRHQPSLSFFHSCAAFVGSGSLAKFFSGLPAFSSKLFGRRTAARTRKS